MLNYGIVKSTVKPEPVKYDDYSVWIHQQIKKVDDEYEYIMLRYTRNEYEKMTEKAEVENRLAALELENATLKSRLAKVEAVPIVKSELTAVKG